MAPAQKRRGPTAPPIDVLEIFSSSPEPEVVISGRHPSASPVQRRVKAVSREATGSSSTDATTTKKKPAPFPLASPPPSPRLRTTPGPSKTTKETARRVGKEVPKVVVEVSDSSDEGEVQEVSGKREGFVTRSGVKLTHRKDAIEIEDDSEDSDDSLPELLLSPSKKRPKKSKTTKVTVVEKGKGKSREKERGKSQSVDPARRARFAPSFSPRPPQYDDANPDPAFDDFYADDDPVPQPGPATPVRVDDPPLPQRRLQEKEPTQEPTPPAQNPTPPPQAGPLNVVNVDEDVWERWEDFGADVDVDEQMMIAMEVADRAERAGGERKQGEGSGARNDENEVEVVEGGVGADAMEVDEREPVVDPKTQAVAAVLEVVPDVEPDHLLGLVEQHLPTYGSAQIAEYLVASLFEDPAYPRIVKVKAAEKRKAGEEDGTPSKRARVDYGSRDRPYKGGPDYLAMTVAALQEAFPHVPTAFVRVMMRRNNNLYAPTYLDMVEEDKKDERERGYQPKRDARAPARSKGKGRELSDALFEEEKKWLEAHLAELNRAANPNADDEEDDDDEELEDDGTFIECGCCFGKYPFERMSQCPDAHLFCRTCIRQFAKTKLGEQNPDIPCMDISGECKSVFSPKELARLLPKKLYALYERLKQQRELKEAGIEDFEECPFCPWGCVMDTTPEQDKLFRCGNEEGGCGLVSCRLCKKKEHVPKTCQEVEDDRHLDGRLAIEEAMTKALMRTCPRCSKAFVKETGCNKMTCTNCRAISCYVCKKEIKDYSHFSHNDPRLGTSSKDAKCPLWENVEQRHTDEVKAAYEKAVADYKRDHPDVELGKDIKIDLPEAPKNPNALPAGYIDPAAFGAGGGGGAHGVWGGVGGWGAPAYVAQPVPPAHLAVEPYVNAVHAAERQLQLLVHREATATRALGQAQVRENSMRRLVQQAQGAAAPSRPVRNARGVHFAGAAVDQYREALSDASIERAAAEHRVIGLREERARAEAVLQETRAQLVQQRAALERWRVENAARAQERLQEQLRAQQEAVAAQRAQAERVRELARARRRDMEAIRAAMDVRAHREMLADGGRRHRARVQAPPAPRARKDNSRKKR